MGIIKKALIYPLLISGALTFSGNALAKQIGDLERKLEAPVKIEQLEKTRENYKIKETKLKEEIVEHAIFDSKFSWKALYNGDYAPRTGDILKKLKTPKSEIVSGGFDQNIRLFSHLGTYTDTVSRNKIDALVEQFEERIDKDHRLLSALKDLLKDRPSYIIVEQFLRDGGKIKAFPNWKGGNYNPNPLILYVGIKGSSNFEVEKKLYHESLHYAFDKMNSILSEARDGGGADHRAIFPLEDRLQIIQQVRNKKIPIFDKSNEGLYGFTKDGKIGEKIQEYINNNDLEGLKSYINSESFQRGYVRASMLELLSSNDYYDHHPEEREKMYKLTDNQVRDIAFLNAVNGAIIRETINIGIQLAQKYSVSLPKAFETPEFQKKFYTFLEQYTKKLEDLDAQPYRSASTISKSAE